jgi:hypothetical protein
VFLNQRSLAQLFYTKRSSFDLYIQTYQASGMQKYNSRHRIPLSTNLRTVTEDIGDTSHISTASDYKEVLACSGQL